MTVQMTQLAPVPEYMRYTPSARIVILIGVMIAMLLTSLDATIINVAIPSMMGNLGVTMTQVTWVSTAYMLANVIVLPLCGWLEANMGRRNLLIASVILFTVSSILCGMANSLGALILFRILQGLGAGPIMATGISTTMEVYPPAKTGVVMSTLGVGIMLGPALGPIIGGWLVDTYSWPWIFYINVPIGIIATVILFISLKKPQVTENVKRPLDILGLVWLSIGLGCMQVFLAEGEHEGWMESTYIRWLLFFCVSGIVLFLHRSLTTAHPIVNLRVFKNRVFSAGSLINFVSGIGIFGTLFILPVFLQDLRHYTAFQSGIIMLPLAGSTLVCLALAGTLVSRCSTRALIMIGLISCVVGMRLLGNVTYLSGLEHLFWPQVLVGSGIGLLAVPLMTASLGGLKGLELGDGSGLFNMARQLGGSIGIAYLTTLINQRMDFHHAMLAENVTVYHPETLLRFFPMQQLFMSKGAGIFQATQQALTALDLTIKSQAVLIAFADAFLFVAIAYAVAIPLVFLLRDAKPAEGTVNMPMH